MVRRKEMDLLIFWLPIAGGILLGGLAANAWYGNDKILSIWLAFAGIVSFLLVAVIQIQQAIERQNSSQSVVAPSRSQIIAQRAYVLVSEAEITDLTEGPPTVAVTIKNTGLTPAFDLIWRATFAAREYPATREIVLDRSRAAPKITLPPGGTLFYKWTFTEWKADWAEKIMNGKAVIVAIGEIAYKDAFGERRFTNYRLNHGGDSISPGKFGPAADGNEAN
jgi:hypothetical protein